MSRRGVLRELRREGVTPRPADAVLVAQRRRLRPSPEQGVVRVRAVAFLGNEVRAFRRGGQHRWLCAQTSFVAPPPGVVFGRLGPRRCVLARDHVATVILDCDDFDAHTFLELSRRIRVLAVIAETCRRPYPHSAESGAAETGTAESGG